MPLCTWRRCLQMNNTPCTAAVLPEPGKVEMFCASIGHTRLQRICAFACMYSCVMVYSLYVCNVLNVLTQVMRARVCVCSYSLPADIPTVLMNTTCVCSWSVHRHCICVYKCNDCFCTVGVSVCVFVCTPGVYKHPACVCLLLQ